MPRSRVLRLAVALVLFLGAVTMAGSQMARATPHASMTGDHAAAGVVSGGHCAGMAQGEKNAAKPMGFECAIACSVILGRSCELAQRIALPRRAQRWPARAEPAGVSPELEPPPPRRL